MAWAFLQKSDPKRKAELKCVLISRKLGILMYAYNTSILEDGAVGSQVQDQPRL